MQVWFGRTSDSSARTQAARPAYYPKYSPRNNEKRLPKEPKRTTPALHLFYYHSQT